MIPQGLRIDAESGRFEFEGFALSKETTRKEFLSAVSDRGVETLGTFYRVFSGDWAVLVLFDESRLSMLRFAIGEPGRTWDDWTVERERENMKTHEAFLQAQLGGPPYEFQWGTMGSAHDEKAGDASIWVRFAEEDQE